VQGRLDEADAHLAIAEAYLDEAPPERERRLRVWIASVRLSVARRRGDVAGVVEHARFLASPVAGQSDEDVRLGSEMRALALMNLGIVEAWTLRLDDAEGHLQEGADLAWRIHRPYIELGCLAQLGFASTLRSFAVAQRRCREAIALAEQYGWGTEWILTPALVTLADTMIWMGQFDNAEPWRDRAVKALREDSGPGIRILIRMATGMLHAGRGRNDRALEEFSAAQRLQHRLMGPHALTSQVTGWTAATQARLGRLDEARASLTAVADEYAGSGEIRNARAVVCLAENDPASALDLLAEVVGRKAPVIHEFTVVEAHLLNALAHHQLGDKRAAARDAAHALACAEPERLVLPFAMTGAGEVLEALPGHETAHAALLTDILDVLRGSALPAREHSSVPLVDELTPSELRVLRYLPTNLSTHEIANQLSVSLNTVNTHIRNIYAKLQAGDRSSAVRRARDLRLLAAGSTR
jgi:LuxR family maltose regulon positive regulatory protein